MAEVHPGGNLGASLCLHFRRMNLFTNVQELLRVFLAPLMASGFVRLSQWAFLYQLHSPGLGEGAMAWPGQEERTGSGFLPVGSLGDE